MRPAARNLLLAERPEFGAVLGEERGSSKTKFTDGDYRSPARVAKFLFGSGLSVGF